KTKAASKYKQSSFKDIIGLVDKAFDVPDFAAQVKKAGSQLQDRPYQSPVFLVGFPRSGTTLSGRILDQHPKLTTSDEIGAIDLIKLHAAQKFNANFSDHIDRIDADMLRYFVDFYNTTQREIPSSMKTGERFIDKMPFNHVNAAVIETVFPRAKFISITRHPLDAVLSCYMQNFRMNTAMVNFLDIENGAKIYRTVYHLWQKQKRVLDLDVHEFRYEDMVADFDTEVGRVLDFIGVEWDDSVREFYRGDGNAPATLTPSRTQVSQKLFTGSQNRWRHFRKHLEPAIEILEPIIEELGYSVDPAEGE
ncbi:MAG: sulfotransferase family protein, partial [Bdellovibrionales bacterium]